MRLLVMEADPKQRDYFKEKIIRNRLPNRHDRKPKRW
jgi:hypothetical protein